MSQRGPPEAKFTTPTEAACLLRRTIDRSPCRPERSWRRAVSRIRCVRIRSRSRPRLSVVPTRTPSRISIRASEEISDGGRHRFRRFRRPAGRLDADPEHAVAIRRGAFNFLEGSSRVDEGYLWTCWPWPPDARGAFDVRESTGNAPRARSHRLPPRAAGPHRGTRRIPPVVPRNAVPRDPGGYPTFGRDRSDGGRPGSACSPVARALDGTHPRVVPTAWRTRRGRKARGADPAGHHRPVHMRRHPRGLHEIFPPPVPGPAGNVAPPPRIRRGSRHRQGQAVDAGDPDHRHGRRRPDDEERSSDPRARG